MSKPPIVTRCSHCDSKLMGIACPNPDCEVMEMRVIPMHETSQEEASKIGRAIFMQEHPPCQMMAKRRDAIRLCWGYAEPYGDLRNYVGFYDPSGKLLHFRPNEEAKAIVEAMLPAHEWALIDSAPQDGTIIYAWVPHTERKDFKWVESGSRKEVLWRTREENQAALSHEGREVPLSECVEGWFLYDSLRITQECRPTHWRPLADAPKTEGK